MCAGAAAARTANKNAVRQYKYNLEVRKRKHMQKLSVYNSGKVQHAKTLQNIHLGLNATYNRAQVKLNRLRNKTLMENQGALLENLQKSQYGNLLGSGRTGRSISRLGVLEAGALGRFYAQKGSALTDAREYFMRGVKLSRQKAKVAQEKSFSKVWAQPVEDVAPPRPAMQNVGIAFFSDIFGFAAPFLGGD